MSTGAGPPATFGQLDSEGEDLPSDLPDLEEQEPPNAFGEQVGSQMKEDEGPASDVTGIDEEELMRREEVMQARHGPNKSDPNRPRSRSPSRPVSYAHSGTDPNQRSSVSAGRPAASVMARITTVAYVSP